MIDARMADGDGRDSGAASGAIHTVFIILMENKNWQDIKGSSSAPYINGTLLPMASYAESYKGDGHPSEPNYIWLEAGDSLGVGDDGDPSSNHQSTRQHLVTLLEAAGISWRSYQEDISGTQCPLRSTGNYAPKHNPMVFFDDVTSNNSASSQRCIEHIRPYPELATDLANGRAARYNFITPNLCHDMHDSCSPLNDETRQGDAWLSTEIPRITASAAYRDGGAIFMLWDESEGFCALTNCPIGMIVLSPLGKGGGYHNSIAYDHSSTLKTVEEIFGLAQPYLRGAGRSTTHDLSDLFRTFP
jgi:phospholipase C